MTDTGIGAAVRRKEDDRFMRGLGRYVADIRVSGMREVAFIRSPVAHARIGDIEVPPGADDRVFTAADLAGVKPIQAASTLDGFKASDYPALASGKVRFAGEPVAMCVADDRAQAEDLAQSVFIDYDDLPAITTVEAACADGAPVVHDHWDDNVILALESGAPFTSDAPIRIERHYRTARQCIVPIEGKGLVAEWDAGRGFLTVHSSTQIPHLVRRALADCLGLKQQQIRVIAPDVGGGFGAKLVVQPEEIAVCWLAIHLRQPVRWIEDRREHLVAGANAREHVYDVVAYADTDGRLIGVDVDIHVDAGAYSVWPFTGCFEAAQAGASFPGPYRLAHFHARSRAVATNKPPIQPYRGVARTGICFALELTIDAIARAVNREPADIRKLNLVSAAEMPHTNITGKQFDSGDYVASVDRAAELIDLPGVRARQREGEADGRLLGVGFGTYTEQTAHGTRVFAGVGIPIVPGHEQARIRFTPDGTFEIMTGLQSHGQSLETTLAQVASEVLDVSLDDVTVIHGDTGDTPFSTGTYASRSIVWGGGAVDNGCRTLGERLRTIGAALLNCDAQETRLERGAIVAPQGEIAFADLASVWYETPEELAPELTTEPLEAIGTYKPASDQGAFSYATHAALVAVDPELGAVEILDYVVVDDCGRRVNPLVVDGQIYGGTAQGIGTALYEESPYDEFGQPLASTFADYVLPGATEIPDIRLAASETLSPVTAYGIKGVGEGGAVAPPAALGNAINDALRPLGVEVHATPMSPKRVYAAIDAARSTAS